MLYLYAVLGARLAHPVRGLRREPVLSLRSGRLWLAAGEMRAAPPPDAARLLAHDAALRRVAGASTAILPARFGSLLADAAELRARVRPREHELIEALRLVSGCVQMTLRLFRTADTGPTSAAGREPRAKTRAAAGAGPGTRYLERALRAQEVFELAALHAALAPVLRAERVERHAGDGLIASAYHLVEQGREQDYRDILARTPPEPGCSWRASGPWPPYAFAPEGIQ